MASETVARWRRPAFARGLFGFGGLVLALGLLLVLPRAEALGDALVVAAATAMLVGSVLWARADSDHS